MGTADWTEKQKNDYFLISLIVLFVVCVFGGGLGFWVGWIVLVAVILGAVGYFKEDPDFIRYYLYCLYFSFLFVILGCILGIVAWSSCDHTISVCRSILPITIVFTVLYGGLLYLCIVIARARLGVSTDFKAPFTAETTV